MSESDLPAPALRRRPGRGGRPAVGGHGVITCVRSETSAIAWSDGVFAGDRAMVEEANLLCVLGERVSLTPTGPWVAADDQDPVAVCGVLLAVCRGQGVLSGDVPDLDDVAGLPEGGIG